AVPAGFWLAFPFLPRAARTGQGSTAASPQLRLSDQALVLLRDQMALNLGDRIHGDADDDEDRGAAERQDRVIGANRLGNDANKCKIERADHGDARQDVIDVIAGFLAGTDARNEAAIFLEILGGFFRIE